MQALWKQKKKPWTFPPYSIALCRTLFAASQTSAESKSPSDKSLFSGCLRLSTSYGGWQLRTKLFTAKRNLPQACSCVNGEKMTGTLTVNAAELLQDVARKKKKVLINLQRQEYVTTANPPEVLLLGCMYWVFTFSSESFDTAQTEHDNQARCPKKPKQKQMNVFFYLWLQV